MTTVYLTPSEKIELAKEAAKIEREAKQRLARYIETRGFETPELFVEGAVTRERWEIGVNLDWKLTDPKFP